MFDKVLLIQIADGVHMSEFNIALSDWCNEHRPIIKDVKFHNKESKLYVMIVYTPPEGEEDVNTEGILRFGFEEQ